jgi:hypothetical protein
LLAACGRPSSTDPIRPEAPVTRDGSTDAAPGPLPTSTETSTTTAPRPIITGREAARRFARAIAADILLYNEDAVMTARDAGAIPASLAKEIAEGRALYRARVSPENEAVYEQAIDEIVLEKRKPRPAP